MTHEQAMTVRMVREWLGVRCAARYCVVMGVDVQVALVWCVR